MKGGAAFCEQAADATEYYSKEFITDDEQRYDKLTPAMLSRYAPGRKYWSMQVTELRPSRDGNVS